MQEWDRSEFLPALVCLPWSTFPSKCFLEIDALSQKACNTSGKEPLNLWGAQSKILGKTVLKHLIFIPTSSWCSSPPTRTISSWAPESKPTKAWPWLMGLWQKRVGLDGGEIPAVYRKMCQKKKKAFNSYFHPGEFFLRASAGAPCLPAVVQLRSCTVEVFVLMLELGVTKVKRWWLQSSSSASPPLS